MTPLEVDARGLRCPLPVIRLATAAKGAPAGTLITVLASDPAARHDVPAWCRMRGHELREMTEMTEVAEVAEVPEVSQASGTDSSTAEGAASAYLRFVVVV